MKSISLRAILFVLLLSAFSQPVLAVDYNWQVGPAASDWNTPGNWNPAGPPGGGGGNFAHINNGGTANITANVNQVQDYLIGDVGAGTGTITQTAGANSVTGWVRIGINAGSTGTYNANGGSLTAPRINVGEAGTGFLNVGGGTLNVTGDGGNNSIIVGAGGPGTINLSSGTINVTTSDFFVGNGGTGTVIQTGGTANLHPGGNGNWTFIGNSSNGSYTISGGSLTEPNRLDIGQNAGVTGTFTQNGPSTVTVGRVDVGVNGVGNLNISSGTFTINGDGANNRSLIVAQAATANGSQVTLSGTGTLTASTGDVMIGQGGSATFTQTGGTANFHPGGNGNWTFVGNGSTASYNMSGAGSIMTEPNRLEIGYGGGNGTFTQNNGSVTVGGNNTGNGVIIGGDNGTTATGVYNLSGGTLTTSRITELQAGGNSTFNFNGGTLRPSVANATFMQGLTAANVQAGGAIIDTNGFNITINQALLNGGAAVTGLTKNGAGTLSLGGTNTYAGATQINAGVLQMTTGTNIPDGSAVTLANVAGATLDLNGQNETIGSLAGGGNLGGNVTLGAGTLTTGGNGNSTTFGGVISGSGGLNKVGGGTMILTGANTFTGTTSVDGGVLRLSAGGSLNGNAGTEIWSGQTGNGQLDVAGGSIGNVQAPAWIAIGRAVTGTGTMSSGSINTQRLSLGSVAAGANGTFTQSGGTMTVTTETRIGETGTGVYTLSSGTFNNNPGLQLGVAGTANGTFNLDGGTLTTGNITKGGGTGVFNLNGGTLRPTGASATFMQGLTTANVRNGGAVVDTNGVNITINQVLAHSSIGGDNAIDGGLTKNGSGTLSLGGTNTYTGNTQINAGILQVTTGTNIPDGSAVTLANVAGATLDVNGQNETIGSLAGGGNLGGNVTLGANGKLTTGGNGNSTTFSGVITGSGAGGNAAFGLNKVGNGTIILNGASTLTSLTQVNGGVLRLTAGGSLNGDANTEIWSGETGNGQLDVAGGSIGNVTAPAWIAIGRSVTGTANLSSGSISTQRLSLGSVAAGANGTLTMTGGTLTSLTETRIGEAGNGTGTLTQSAGTFTASGGVGATDVSIGYQGTGNLSLSGTAVADFNNGGGWTIIGNKNASANSVGTLTISGNAQLTAHSRVIVGSNGRGSVTQSGTSTVNVTNDVSIGDLIGLSSALTPDVYNMQGGTLNTNTANNPGTGMLIGFNGFGVVNQSGGTVTNNRDIQFGGNGGTGTYNLTGGVLNVTGNITDVNGTSTLTIDGGTLNMSTNGSNITVDNFNIGLNAPGSYTHNGTRTISVNNNLVVGGNSTGAFNVNNTTTTTVTGQLQIGDNATGVGTVTQTGGTVNVNQWTDIGHSGKGTYNISGGTLNANHDLNVGDQNGTAAIDGSLIVSGTGAVKMNNAAQNFYIGKNGSTGEVIQTGGSVFSAQDILVGSQAGSFGNYSLSVGGTVDTNRAFIVGELGTGTMNQSAGTVTANQWLQVGRQAGSVGTYILSGGTAQGLQTVNIGEGGVGTMTVSGTGQLVSGGQIEVSRESTSAGSSLIINSAGASVNSGSNVLIGLNAGSQGTINISAGSLTVGGGAGSKLVVGQSGGSLANPNQLIVSGGTVTTPDLIVGQNAGSFGQVNQTGGLIKVTNPSTLIVGDAGTGVVNHSAGTTNDSGNLILGNQATGNGTYNLSNTGILIIGNNEQVGNAGVGVFNQSGGTHTLTGAGGVVGGPMLGRPSSFASPVTPTGSGHLTVNNNAASAYNLSGGLLDLQDYASGGANHAPANQSVIQLNTGGTGGVFNFTGGTLRDVSIVQTANNNSTFTQNGAGSRLEIGQNQIGPGATMAIFGNYNLVSGVLAADIFGAPVDTQHAYSMLDPNDRLDVTGTVNLNGKLEANFLNATSNYPLLHQAFNVVTSAQPNGITLGPNFSVPGAYYRIVNINGFPGQTLQVFVPEPGTIAIWSLLGLAGVGYAWRKARKKQ